MRVELDLPDRVAPAEPVPMTLRVTNVGEQAVELGLGGRPVAFDIIVARPDGSEVWSRLHDAVIPQILQLRLVEPGESLEFTAEWDQRDNSGAPVEPGHYRVHGVLPAEEMRLLSEVRDLFIRG